MNLLELNLNKVTIQSESYGTYAYVVRFTITDSQYLKEIIPFLKNTIASNIRLLMIKPSSNDSILAPVEQIKGINFATNTTTTANQIVICTNCLSDLNTQDFNNYRVYFIYG